MIASIQPTLTAPLPRPDRADNLAPAPADRVTLGGATHGSASGWIGNSGLSASVVVDDRSADVNGWLGSRSVDLHETIYGNGGSISGWVTGGNGSFDSVNISVNRSGSGDDTDTWYSGYIGRSFVNLHERSDEGSGWISGTVGDRSVSVSRSSGGSSIDYSGSVFGPGGGGGFVSVHAGFNGPVDACDPLVPLLALG